MGGARAELIRESLGPPVMFTKLVHYLTALAVLGTSAYAYDRSMTVWLTPPDIQKVPPKPHQPAEGNHAVADLFPEGDWRRGPCKRLQTADGVMLFQNWQQVAETQWRLWPITIVVGRGLSDQQDTDPIIMHAQQGAEIRFAGSFDVMSGGAPPIDRGRMSGKVEIQRPASDPDKKPLYIQTSNVGMDSQKLWTTEQIHLRMGETEMIGRDLTLHLARSNGAAIVSGGATSILDRMELIYLDKLVIPLDNGPLWEADTGDTPRVSPSTLTTVARTTSSRTKNSRPTVSLNCNGRVEYDFALDQISLYDSVTLVHDVPRVGQDKFSCEKLELRLRSPESKELVREGPLDWIDHIHASGWPAKMEAPSLNFAVSAEEIDFDAIGGLLRAEGSQGVNFRRGTIQGHLSELAYQYNPQRPEALGTVDTFGAGSVEIKDDEIPIRQLRWNERLKIQPVGTTQLDAVESDMVARVSGDVEARFVDGGHFKAGAVECVLKPAFEAPRKLGEKPKRTLRPDRFQATGAVHIDNNAVSAATERLIVFFTQHVIPVEKAKQETEQGSQSIRQWVTQPNKSSAPVKAPVARPRPTIRGDLITAKLNLFDGEVQATDLSVRGNVKLVHTVESGEAMMPVEMTGTELRLGQTNGKDVLHLGSRAGKQSVFKLGDGFFVGPQIRIWPTDNVVRIEGAGQFQMPTAVLPSSLSGDASDQIRWINAPLCKWNGEMVFNGKTAVLTNGVDITAKLRSQNEPWSVQMKGDRLEIVLLSDVQVGEIKSMKSAAIQQITLSQSATEPVAVEALRRGNDGVLEARHLFRAPRLTLHPSGGGKLIGAGPGSYRSWMYADPDGPLSVAAQDESDQSKLMGVHLVYEQAMQGDLVKQVLEFVRGVRVGVRPVEHWEEAIDARRMNSISSGESTVDCDSLLLAVEPGYKRSENTIGLPTPWEMQATGGVMFRYRNKAGLLEGSAARAAYASRKELFTIVGSAERGAVIQKTELDGTKGPKLTVRELSIDPNTYEIPNMVFEGLEVGELPQRSKR